MGASEPAAGAGAALGGIGNHRVGRRPRALCRLAKVETAIFRNKTIVFEYYTMGRDEVSSRRVDPYHLLFQGGQFYLLGFSHERKAIRVFRLTRIRGKVSYATKAEHDFHRPEDFDPRAYASRADWQLGEERGVAEVLVSERIAWQIERHFGRYGEVRCATEADAEGSIDLGEAAEDGDMIFSTGYSNPRSLVSWVLGLGANARLLGPPELVEEFCRRMDMLLERHEEDPPASRRRRGPIAPEATSGKRWDAKAPPMRRGALGPPTRRSDPSASPAWSRSPAILIAAGRLGERVVMAEVCERLQISDEELREDVNVLNVVNFGGGSYVLYAEIKEEEGEIEVDPEPYSDNFDRPARLLPVEAKALIAAIDLIGEHIPEGSLASARTKIVAALGEDPMEQGLQVAPPSGDDTDVARVISKAIVGRRLIELEYFKENEDEISLRKVEPYALTNGREGWYVACFDPDRDGVRHFRLDRIKTPM